eukprot:m.5615 g.5615  ORF g.5615 m.5615 type:complete len:322 (+) comp13647_c0_seq2:1375-2340(+)
MSGTICRILACLSSKEEREDELLPMSTYEDEKIASLRDVTVSWLTDRFRRTPQSLVLAVNFFDRFLAIVQVKTKYLKCVASTCFFIAAKTTVESKDMLSSKRITRMSGGCFSPRDLIRMEKIVLNKLNFQVNAVTPFHFIQVYYLLARSSGFLQSAGISTEEYRQGAVRRLQKCIQNYRFLTFRTSTLALALLMAEFKQLPGIDWLDVSIRLQMAADIPGQELAICYEAVQIYFFESKEEELSSRLGSTGEEEDRDSDIEEESDTRTTTHHHDSTLIIDDKTDVKDAKEWNSSQPHQYAINKTCRAEAELLREPDTEVFVV